MSSQQLDDAFEHAFHDSAVRHERVWIFMVLVLLAVLLVGTMFYVVNDYGVVTKGTGSAYLRDPDQIMKDPAYATGKPVRTGPNSYAVYVVGHTWAWSPNTIHLTEGAQTTFYVSSADVLHGFEVQGTTINVTAIPGSVGKVSYTFKRPGTYQIICNEYCGIEHQAMIGKIVVSPKGAS